MRHLKNIRRIRLLVVVSLALASPMQPACAQTDVSASDLIEQLTGPEPPVEVDVATLRQQALERIKSNADSTPLKRRPIAPQLMQLSHFDFDVVFDSDSALIRPQSYQTVGRIADALSNLKLLPYSFIVIDHTEATGRRDANLTLSQRRAESIRAVLVKTFGISSRRLQALGLGEEQLLDSARPASPTNARAQLVTIGLAPTVASQLGVTNAVPANKAGSTASKKRR
jgi:OOP family OmpA-OmpF porin